MSEPVVQQVGVVGLFDNVDEFVQAAGQVKSAGYKKWDCYTPYPVHGLDQAMGMGESKLPFLSLSMGFVGLITALVMTGYLSGWHYPIQIGGKDLLSWQAFVPIYFELFVLFAAIATFLGVIVFCKLGRWHSPLHDSGVMREITCNRFAIVMCSDKDNSMHKDMIEILKKSGCQDIRPLNQNDETGDTLL